MVRMGGRYRLRTEPAGDLTGRGAQRGGAADGCTALGAASDRARADGAASGPAEPRCSPVAAFMFSGAVNGTATAAGLPLMAILIVWGIRRAGRRALLGWWSALARRHQLLVGGLVARAAHLLAAVLRLRRGRPRHHPDHGLTSGLRGMSNWVNYPYLGDQPELAGGLRISYAAGPGPGGRTARGRGRPRAGHVARPGARRW